MHQPAWLLWDTIKLAGIEPTAEGYTIDPVLPMRDFTLRLPDLGLEWRGRHASGYVRSLRRDRLRMVVRAPSGGAYRATVAGRPVTARRRGADVVFTLDVQPGRVAAGPSIRPARDPCARLERGRVGRRGQDVQPIRAPASPRGPPTSCASRSRGTSASRLIPARRTSACHSTCRR